MRTIHHVLIAALAVAIDGAAAQDAQAMLCAKPKPGATVLLRDECKGSEASIEPGSVVLCANKSGNISFKRKKCARSQTAAVDLVPSVPCPRPYLLAAPPMGVTLKARPSDRFELEPKPKRNLELSPRTGFSVLR